MTKIEAGDKRLELLLLAEAAIKKGSLGDSFHQAQLFMELAELYYPTRMPS